MVPVSDIGECISECQVYTFGGEALCNDFTFYDDSDVSFFFSGTGLTMDLISVHTLETVLLLV